MIDNIVELDNNKKYIILDEKNIDNKKYYFGLKLDKKEEPTNKYLFFEEMIVDKDAYLNPIFDDNTKGVLLTAFTINYLNMVYDEI